MQQLQQTQPQLFAVIQQNPGAFMNLILGGDPNAGVPAGGQPAAGGHGGRAHPSGSLQVTQEEMEAINRLVSLGFPKHKTAEAYFACDKNEEFAANFLFESGVEDDDTVMQRTLAESAAAVQQPPQQPAQPSNPSGDSSSSQQPPAEGGDKKPDDDDSSLA